MLKLESLPESLTVSKSRGKDAVDFAAPAGFVRWVVCRLNVIQHHANVFSRTPDPERIHDFVLAKFTRGDVRARMLVDEFKLLCEADFVLANFTR